MSKISISLIDTGAPREEIDEPLGIETITSPIRHRYDESEVDVSLYFLRLPGHEKVSKDSIQGKRIVGISTKLNSYNTMKDILYEIRSAGEDPLVVIGNMYSTYAYKDILKNYPDVICVRGEGEDAFSGIVKSLTNNPDANNKEVKKRLIQDKTPNLVFAYEDKIVETPRRLVELSTLPRPTRDILPQILSERGVVLVEGSRGCPYSKCKYCAIASKYGYPVWRGFPTDWIVKEFIDLSKAGVRSPYFTDEDFFGPNPYRVVEIANRTIEAKDKGLIKSDFNFYINARVNTILGRGFGGTDASTPLLSRLREAGLREVFLGIESGSKDQMKRYRKASTAELNIRAIELLRSLDIQIDIGFIMFDPEMNLNDLKYNTGFLRKAGLSNHDARMTKQLRVEPYTPMETELLKKGVVSRKLDVDDLTYPYEICDPKSSAVQRYFREWEKGNEDFVYRLQTKSRGETPTEEDRVRRKSALGKFRELDLEFLEECINLIEESTGILENKYREVRKRFDERRQSLMRNLSI